MKGEMNEAGREMDVEIAVRVMAWSGPFEEPTYTGSVGSERYIGTFATNPDGDLREIPPYSRSIADAWEVVEKLKERGLFLSLSDQRHGCYREDDGTPWVGWFAEVCDIDRDDEHGPIPVTHEYSEDTWSAYAATAPLAICLAALRAITSTTDGEVRGS